MQSPAAMPELPLMLRSMWFHMSFGADQIAVPSEPRTARITPCTSTNWLPLAPVCCEKVLKMTAGEASVALRRITTGVLITWTKSGYSRSERVRLLPAGASGPSAVGNGHHHSWAGCSKAPCGT